MPDSVLIVAMVAIAVVGVVAIVFGSRLELEATENGGFRLVLRRRGGTRPAARQGNRLD